MNFINQKVTVKPRTDYHGSELPSGDGIVIEENRGPNYGLNGLYVMFPTGHVTHVSLIDIIFKEPDSLKDREQGDLMSALGMILGASSPAINC